jgi:C1A family cysteine protease
MQRHKAKIVRSYGCIPDDTNKSALHPKINFLSNNPDLHRGLKAVHPQVKPTKCNLVLNLPHDQLPYDQGQLGSCTANGLSFAYCYCELKQKNKGAFMPSRLFIYYNERLIENSVNTDSGAQIYDGIRALQQYGVCSEEEYPYDAPNFTKKPADKLYVSAKHCEAKTFYKLCNPTDKFDNTIDPLDNNKNTDTDIIDPKMSDHVKAALNSGYPVIMGFSVFDSFESDNVANTGILPMPRHTESQVGGHCVVIVGFDDSKRSFLVRNSWGTNWGCHPDGSVPKDPKHDNNRGYFMMPYAFVDGIDSNNTPYCSDFWVITSVAQQGAIAIKAGDDILAPNIINLNPGTNNGGVVNPS